MNPIVTGQLESLTREQLREKIELLESKILSRNDPVEMKPVHRFVEGLYAREITIPKDVVLTGKIHKFEHLNFLMKGKISVLTEDGIKEITAPAVIPSMPGTKRVGYTHEETIWVTVHATDCRDESEIEDKLTCSTHEQFIEFCESERLRLEIA